MNRILIIAAALLLLLNTSLTAAEIHEAAQAGDLEVLRTILAEDPQQVNSVDSVGSLPIHLAALNGHLDAVKLLIANGAAVSAGDGDNTTPLICAAMRGHTEVITFLLDSGASIAERDNFGNTPFLASVGSGNLELVKDILDQGIDINSHDNRGNSALHMAVWRGRTEMIKLLADRGANLNARDNDSVSALAAAAYAGQQHVAELLFELGADVNEAPSCHGHPPLFAAVWSNRVEVARLLVGKGANLDYRNQQGESALHLAASRGHQEIAQLLIDAGIDVNVTDNYGGTPLTQAAWSQNEMVLWLIDHGAKMDALTDSTMAPIICAIYAGNTEIVRTLVNRGATVNCKSGVNDTPLKIAAMRGNEELVTVLLDAGAEVNAVDAHYGRTPLHWSAIRGQSGLAGLLLSHGADIDARDREGNSPLYYASRYANRNVADLLKTRGADTSGMAEVADSHSLLRQTRNKKEAAIWHLGHSGWAIKTQNHFLIFDYFEEPGKPDLPCLANGHIAPEEIKDLNVTVFSTHEHGDHYDTTIFGWREHIPQITYILGHRPDDKSEYEYIPPRADQTFGDLKMRTITSTDAGVGYLINVDGLNIFHAGDHANGDIGLNSAYTDEIDYLASLGMKIDLAFLPITGCSLGSPESVKEGVYYALEKLAPKVFFPQHSSGAPYQYREFAEQARSAGFSLLIPCAENRGDCFLYRDGAIM